MNPTILAFTGLALMGNDPFTAQLNPIEIEDGVRNATVSYADLDLGNADGVQTLVGQVRRVASKLCTGDGRRDIEQFETDRRCFDRSIKHAQPQIDRAVASRLATLTTPSLHAR